MLQSPCFLASTETEQDSVGLLGMEDFLCFPFLVSREQTPPFMTFLEFQKGRLEQLLIREGRGAETREEQPRNNSARDTHNNIFKLFTEIKPPTNGRCQHSSFQRRPPVKRLPETRLKECRPCTHPDLISNPALELLL